MNTRQRELFNVGTAEEVAANNALMDRRAGDLAQLLNKLQWPEAQGPYYPRGTAPHVIQNVGGTYNVAINYRTAMFNERLAPLSHRFKFVDLPTDESVDTVAWLATQFLDWITT